MRSTYTYGKVVNGELRIHNRSAFLRSVAQIPDGRVKLTVERTYNKRSTPQNAYYWGVLIAEFKEGYYDRLGEIISPDDAHGVLKLKCNSIEIVNEESGEVMNVPKSTTEMTTIQFEEYMEQCRRFIKEWFGRTVPMPNEQLQMF